MKQTLKPKKRSKLRLYIGKKYYTFKRYLLWISGKYKFAKKKTKKDLKYKCFEHKSLLLRNLRDVDMIYQYNKIINLKIAVKKLDRIIIRPGETFSYWKLIGKTTKRKGSKTAKKYILCLLFRPPQDVVAVFFCAFLK